MFQLQILQADYGDCLLLVYGTLDQPKYILVDGGPHGVFDDHLNPVLQEVAASGGGLHRVILSHVDEDHVVGLIDLVEDLQWRQSHNRPELIKVDGLWHNAFELAVGEDENRTLTERMETDSSLSAFDQWLESLTRSIRQGDQLNRGAQQLGIPINADFAPDHLVRAGSSAEPITFDNLTIHILGPTQKNLDKLQKEWLRWLKKQQKEADPRSAAEAERDAKKLDTSYRNLSSIMFLAESDGRSILFTGDGRGDHLLASLEEQGLLQPDGSLHVDILKLPHHGSHRNVTAEFFHKVTADTYVICANGRHDNPDTLTLHWLVEAAQTQSREFTLVATNQAPSLDALLQSHPPDQYGYALEVLQPNEHILTLNLGESKAKPQSKWTFMVYVAGDNNLSAAGDRDLEEMRSIGSTPDVNIVVEFDNHADEGTHRYLIQKDGVDETVEALGETDSGDPNVLLDFVDWAKRAYPADNYVLVLWNHGGGWKRSDIDQIAQEVQTLDYTEEEGKHRSSQAQGSGIFFRTTWKRVMSLPTSEEREVCSDDGTGHSIDTIELGEVMEQVVKILGKPLDLLGMDACLMSNLEVAYQVSPYVNYMVASEELEPNDGWPYDAVLAHLVAEPTMAPQTLATHIVEDYIDSYRRINYSSPVTQSALALNHLAAIVEPIDQLATHLAARMPDAALEVWRAQRKSASFPRDQATLWDLGDFVQALQTATTDHETEQLAESVCMALDSGVDRFVVAEDHMGQKVEHCKGVTIYLPAFTGISRFYDELTFSQKHQWLHMLQAYYDE